MLVRVNQQDCTGDKRYYNIKSVSCQTTSLVLKTIYGDPIKVKLTPKTIFEIISDKG